MKSQLGTKARALLEAQGLLQSMGFNGFSFQHVADRLGIRKASLFDHFSSKEELGKELIQEYHRSFVEWTKALSAVSPQEKIRAFFSLLTHFSSAAGKMCPLSVLIADFHSLPKKVKRPVLDMYRFQLEWFQRTVKDGQFQKIFREDQSSHELAELLMAVSLGSQPMARIESDCKKILTLEAQVAFLLAPKLARPTASNGRAKLSKK